MSVLGLLLCFVLHLTPTDLPMTQEVTEHVDDIIRARTLLGLDSADHPVELYLALLHIESGGREDLTDQDSYIGPLQIGEAYIKDATEYANKHHPSVAAELPTNREQLRSDAYLSLVVTMLYMERYQGVHAFDPYRMAGLHKGGIGSAKQVKRYIRRGLSVKEAHRRVALDWRFPEGHKRAGQRRIPFLFRYVYGEVAETGEKEPASRFAQAFKKYSRWYDQQKGNRVVEVADADAPQGVDWKAFIKFGLKMLERMS